MNSKIFNTINNNLQINPKNKSKIDLNTLIERAKNRAIEHNTKKRQQMEFVQNNLLKAKSAKEALQMLKTRTVNLPVSEEVALTEPVEEVVVTPVEEAVAPVEEVAAPVEEVAVSDAPVEEVAAPVEEAPAV